MFRTTSLPASSMQVRLFVCLGLFLHFKSVRVEFSLQHVGHHHDSSNRPHQKQVKQASSVQWSWSSAGANDMADTALGPPGPPRRAGNGSGKRRAMRAMLQKKSRVLDFKGKLLRVLDGFSFSVWVLLSGFDPNLCTSCTVKLQLPAGWCTFLATTLGGC